ncbi:MAG TPA: ribonuclease E/G, partial [Dialister sp.]|nr:ribonuclease E/G [Dialister sp.]
MKQILLHVTEEEKVLAVLDEGVLSDISVEKAEETDLVGRVYKGVIRNVVPSINGMFVDIGIGKNGFLRTKDILS